MIIQSNADLISPPMEPVGHPLQTFNTVLYGKMYFFDGKEVTAMLTECQ